MLGILYSASENSALHATPMAVALAGSPYVLLIPGTSSPAHLRKNLAAAVLTLPPESVSHLSQTFAA